MTFQRTILLCFAPVVPVNEKKQNHFPAPFVDRVDTMLGAIEEKEIRRFGCFFAILPKHPSISPKALKLACDNSQFDSSMDFIWTHHRYGALDHPQLSDPLPFLEISGVLTLRDAELQAESVCDDFVQRLCNEDPVGNAEVLLVLPETQIPVLPTDLPISDTTPGTGSWTAKSVFERYGLVSLDNIIPMKDLKELEHFAIQEFQQLHASFLGRKDKKKHFKEIMARDDNRFDVRLDCGFHDKNNNICQRLGHTDGGWIPVVQTLLGKDCTLIRCGCVVSLPGTNVQYWHSDGVHVGPSSTLDHPDGAAPVHALCVFVPLIDLNESTGYTEFWAGSHHYSKLLSKKGDQSLPGGTKGILKRTSCLLYDYRTIHRGMSNTSGAIRPVCYFLYTKVGYEFVENQNFTEQSVMEES